MDRTSRRDAVGVAIAVLAVGCGRIGFGELPPEACVVAVDPIPAGAYYLAVDGDDAADGLDPTRAWATIAHAVTVLVPGDTLVVRDGTYPNLSFRISGAPGAPITIRAEHDGGAVFDGATTNVACNIQGTMATHITDVVLSGVRCVRGGFQIDQADRIVARRITSADALPFSGGSQYNAIVYNSADVLLEDFAAWGEAIAELGLVNSDRVTVRRAYVRWTSGPPSATYVYALLLSGSRDSVIENVVATGVSGPNVGGIAISSPTYYGPADRNLVVGSVAHGIDELPFPCATTTVAFRDNTISNSVMIDTVVGAIDHRGGANLVVDHFTATGTGGFGYGLGVTADTPKDPGFEISSTITSSVFVDGQRGFTVGPTPYLTTHAHSHNDLFDLGQPYGGLSTADPSEVSIDPAYDVATYGPGAYLIRPTALDDMGAEVLYRYADGVLTDQPLWPWPMERRIADELGRSVTWESGGGLWRVPPPVIGCP